MGSLQKEWLQNGDLGKINSKKLGKPPGNQFEQTTSWKGLNGDSWTSYSQPATDYHDKGWWTLFGTVLSVGYVEKQWSTCFFNCREIKAAYAFWFVLANKCMSPTGTVPAITKLTCADNGHWNEGAAKKRDDQHARINAFILKMDNKK